MKIARWMDGTINGEGFIVEGTVVPFAGGTTVASVLADGREGLVAALAAADRAGARPIETVRLVAPLAPAAIRDFVAFEEHVEGISASVNGTSEVVAEWYEAPTFYFSNPHTVIGPDEIVAPPVTRLLDFELEIAAVIGGLGGSNLDAAAGKDAIFGYTIMNDWSARDLQSREMKVRLGPAKGKDFGLSLGPWIVTADELDRYTDAEGFLAIRAEAWINGVLIGEDLVSDMGWPFGELVAYASRNSLVVPGDVLGSGTIGNGGCLGELWGRRGELTPPPLREGDEVRLVVEGIGELVNRVGPQVEGPELPPARVRPRLRSRVE
jgi:2-keto-4-pentenoate hydratase/2-oxohepta-3-ene-1,7-dioic acid hydratase in catechol pathway